MVMLLARSCSLAQSVVAYTHQMEDPEPPVESGNIVRDSIQAHGASVGLFAVALLVIWACPDWFKADTI